MVDFFLQANVDTKVVMIAMLFGSIWLWAKIFERLFLFLRARREGRAGTVLKTTGPDPISSRKPRRGGNP
jgi:hypothetical protein